MTNQTNYNSTNKDPCILSNYFYAYVTAGTLIVLINGIISIFILTTKILRKCASNYFLLSLSINDALNGVTVILFNIFGVFLNYKNNCKYTTITLSTILYYILKFHLLNSVTHLILLSSERAFSIFAPLRHRARITKKKISIAVFSSWLVCGVMTTVEWLVYKYESTPPKNLKILILVNFTIFACVPSIILLVQFFAIIYTIYSYQNVRGTNFLQYLTKKQKLVWIYFVMFLSFLMLTIPFFVARVYASYKGIRDLYPYFPMLGFLRVLPSLLNPFMYTLFKEDFYKEIEQRINTMKSRFFPPKNVAQRQSNDVANITQPKINETLL